VPFSKTLPALLLAAALIPAPARAQNDAETAYVVSNLLSVFYHELGHALIDVAALPVFGQEEDAADTASILLIDAIFDEETASEIALDAALGFAAEAELVGDDVQFWSEHGADMQRFFNLVCLFYGADPERRVDFAQDLGLPDERAETCPDEFDLALASWGPVLDALVVAGGGDTIALDIEGAGLTQEVIGEEVRALNVEMRLPAAITVAVESCGEANGFYDPDDRRITICTEFEVHLREIAP